MISRLLTAKLLARSNCFLWGPRQTGKSTLLRQLFPDSPYYDLLSAVEFRRLSANPGLFREEVLALPPDSRRRPRPVIVDEIQKLPELVDEVQRLIAHGRPTFILSGSSARKILRGGGNLLGGRAVRRELLPLSCREIPDFHLDRALNHGLLPPHYLAEDPREALAGYVGTYLREEVLAESLIRNLPAFQRFLEIAALSNGQPVHFAVIGRETGVSAPAVRGYFDVLTDTLLGTWVGAWQRRPKRRLVQAPRFYFFDVGVVNEIARRGKMKAGSAEFGSAFEHYIQMEIRAWHVYTGQRDATRYWRTSSGLEVDFILADGALAVEVKSTENPTPDHLKGLRAFAEDHRPKSSVLVCRAGTARKTADGILILPWRSFIERLWSGDLEDPS
jgi:predicted AAA+ superfamily ATPase